MCIDDRERRLLPLQVLDNRDKRHVLENIRKISGVEGMAIVHGVCVNFT